CLSSEPDGTPLSQPKSSTPNSDLPKTFTAPVNEVSSIIPTSSSSLPNQAATVTSNDPSSASPPPTVTPAEPSEPPTDPHKRGRKFLYRLAPLLKLTLPSRVERRRTQSVFNLQDEAAPTGKSGSYLHQNNQALSPRSSGIRTTACERQWIRHGTLVHHCVSFIEDKSLTGMGGSFASGTQRCTIGLALRNADLYVQRLWHELQLRVRGEQFEKELGHRVSLAKKVIAHLVSFDLSGTDSARQAEPSIYSESSSVPLASYIERIRIAHLAVADILEKADRVEQAWSSEARMTADIVDWILPEVWSRLTCLRQWSGRLLIIQRGLSQLCAFLHNCSSGTIRCSTHSRPQQGSNLHETEGFSEEIITCPLLAVGSNEAWKRLCRQFLLDSWYMCALPNHEQSPTQRGVSTEIPGGYSVALIRLNRLVDRLLTEIRGNRLGGRSPLPEPVPSRGKATQTCSPLHRNATTVKNVSSTIDLTMVVYPRRRVVHTFFTNSRGRTVYDMDWFFLVTSFPIYDDFLLHSCSLFQRIREPCLPARALCVKCSSENVISSVNSDPALLREPQPSGVNVGSSSQCAASPNHRVIQAQNNGSTAIELSTLTWWHTLRKKLQQRSPASYASVVKRRSWNGCISPLELNIPHSDGVQTPHVGGLPVKWEICSPSHSVSPHGRSTSSTPSPPSSPHRSDSDHSSVSTTPKSVSDNSSSSSSSLNSFPQTGCALAESPTSTTSEGTSYWSVDLPDIHPLEKSPSTSASPVSPVQQDVGLELGLPPLVFLWLCLARIPFYVTRESVTMKLEQYADRVNACTAPDRLSLIHLVHELRSLMITALRITRAYRRRLVVALKLNTVAQIPPVVPLLSTRSVLSWPPTETQSDDSDGESGVYASSHHRVPASKPVWFLEATEQVRQFLDDATSPNSLVKLIEAYSDCLVRLLDIECSTLKGSPSDLRSLVEREWDHIRRVYRQLHRCRGGIHYASLSGPGIIDQHRQTVELTFVRLCKNVIGFLSERFAPQLGVWARCAATDPFKYAGCPKDIPIWEEASQSSGPPATNLDSSASFHTEATRSLSTKSSPWICTGGVRNELFQEFNESWREIRAWLNCLLDLTAVVCNDLDTAVLMNLTIPASRPKTVGRNVPADAGQARTTTVPDVAIKCRSSSSKSMGKMIRELRQMGHVLLYSWDKSGSCQPSSSGWNFGCVFIWSPFLRHASASSTPHVSETHTCSRDNSLVIASSETRRAVRKHISMFVHRMAKQLIFKPRKPPPACFFPMPDLSGSDVRYVRPGKLRGLIKRIPAKNGFGGSVEYLLVCPGLPVKLWNGLAYNFMDVRGVPAYQSRSNHVRRSWYALQWLVALCCDSALSSTPLIHQDHHVSGLPISLTTWLLSDYPHAAWSLLRDSSDRLRRWLAFSCLNPSVLGGFKVGDEHLSVDENSPGTRACSFQMAPIMADLYNSVHSLRRNLCDLSARLQGSLLVMESHLRSYLDSTESAPRAFNEASALASPIHCGERPSPTRSGSVSDGRDAVTLYALGVDPVQRAFSVVFGFHKTLIRLLSIAPVRAPFYSEERDPSGERVSLHTRLVHLGVRLLRSWADYVTSRYPRGRGRIPRWANDACHFAYRLCQPRSVKFLDARKVSSLEATLNALIPHLVGERAAGESPTPVLHPHLVDHGPFSRCHSAAIPGRIHSPPCPNLPRPRRVHSLHGFLPNRKLSFHHQQSYKCAKSPCKAMGISISEETPYPSDIRRQKTLTLLAKLEARRDSQLRSLCLIGRTRLEQHHTPTKSSQTVVLHPGACGGNTPKDVEYFPTHLGRRHFPYTWNRGRLIGMVHFHHISRTNLIGATGKVFQAFNLQTQEMMAVKEIQLDHDFDDQSPVACPETLERLNSFRRECDLLSNLSHPALVRFLGADEQTPRVLRLFTELCSAGTLADVVKDSPSESLVRCYASDLASAIVYLHERGIVHRDIKPSNVFLVAHPAPIESARPNAIQNGATGPQDQSRRFLRMPLLKLGDFSHSLRLHSFSSNAHGIAGTVCYMAPEVCRSSKSGYGKPCDIWSYCCVLLELITGRRPWYHVPEMHGVFYKLCCDETPLLPKVKPESGEADGSVSLTPGASVYTSAEAFTLLRAGLTPDPSKRPTAPELFQFCFVQSPLSERR
ncbi:kinase domain protein, partial [Opisthorchis viverrini]